MPLVEANKKYMLAKYGLEELRGEKSVPFGVDAACKEDYVTDEDFRRAFGCTREEYGGMPGWKQKEAKKKSGLF